MTSSLIQKPTAITELYERCVSDTATHTEITQAAHNALEQASPWPILWCAITQLAKSEEANQSARTFVAGEIDTLEPSYHYRATGDHWTVYRYEAATGTEDWTANVDTEAWAIRMVTMGNEQVIDPVQGQGDRVNGNTLRLVVHVGGGLVQSVYCPDPRGMNVSVTVYDYDTEGADQEEIALIRQGDGSHKEACITQVPVSGSAAIALEDVLQAPVDANREEYRVVALSSGHLTEEDRDELAGAATDGDSMVLVRETGFFIKLYEEDQDGSGESNYRHGVSDSIKDIIRWAYNAGYRMIEFDSDAPQVALFPTYDW